MSANVKDRDLGSVIGDLARYPEARVIIDRWTDRCREELTPQAFARDLAGLVAAALANPTLRRGPQHIARAAAFDDVHTVPPRSPTNALMDAAEVVRPRAFADATHLGVAWAELARGSGLPVVAVVFDTPAAVCRALGSAPFCMSGLPSQRGWCFSPYRHAASVLDRS